MGPLTIEQKLQQHTYNASDAVNTDQNQINLGGFAVSFKDLLQRVGARLDHAFSTTDKGAGLGVRNDNTDVSHDARDYASNRETSSDRGDDRDSSHRSDASTSASAEPRDSNTDRTADSQRDNNAGDNRSDHNDARGNDDQAASDNNDSTDTSASSNDTSNNETASDSNAGDNNGEASNENATGTEAQNANGANGQQTATAHTSGVDNAAAIYAAGLIGATGTETKSTDNNKSAQQTANIQSMTDGPAAQATAGVARKGVHASQGNNQQNTGNQNNAQAAQQQAGNISDKGVNANLQDQAQQLSRMIGANNRASINVTTSTEQNQLTSRPALTAANASILTQDVGNGGNAGTQAQTGQNQGQNAQTTAQSQAAAQQQVNVNAQATAQVTAQTQTTGNSGQGGTLTQGIQSNAGGAQHGGGDALNNATQTANAAQNTQQTQQTREATPQQQAQHAQRGNLAGSSVSEQITVKITKALQTGVDKISIQLKPAELGRVDVKLEMTHDGRVMTVVSAEKQDTLDLLRRDSSELQRALADAGLQNGDMEFNLKGQEQQTAGDEDAKNGDSSIQAEAENDEAIDDPNDGVLTAWESGIFADGSVDMRA